MSFAFNSRFLGLRPRNDNLRVTAQPERELLQLPTRGVTQVDLATRIGTIQAVVSDYESDRRRLHAETIVRVAQALSVSADELLGAKGQKGSAGAAMSLRLTRRLQKLDALPRAR